MSQHVSRTSAPVDEAEPSLAEGQPIKRSTAKTAAEEQRYTEPELRERLKRSIHEGTKGGRAGQWTARKAQLLATEYRKAGGDYIGGGRDASQERIRRYGR